MVRLANTNSDSIFLRNWLLASERVLGLGTMEFDNREATGNNKAKLAFFNTLGRNGIHFLRVVIRISPLCIL